MEQLWDIVETVSSHLASAQHTAVPEPLAAEAATITAKARKGLFDGTANHEKKEWRVAKEKEGVKVWVSKSLEQPKHDLHRVRYDIKPATKSQVLRAWTTPEERVKWDKEVERMATVFSFTKTNEENPDEFERTSVEVVVTKGLVTSSRIFVDLRHTIATKTSVFSVVTTIDASKFEPLKPIFDAVAGTSLELGHHFIGGITLTQIDKEKVRVTMAAQTDMGGWVPSFLFDSATAGELISQYKFIQKGVKDGVAKDPAQS